MGLSLFRSNSIYEKSSILFQHRNSDKNEVILPNPRPDNYSLIRCKTINGYLIIELKYHDCVNYEGRKIMVYKCTLDDLLKQKLIDPHFCNNKKYLSPIARFEPTVDGWNNACKLAKIL